MISQILDNSDIPERLLIVSWISYFIVRCRTKMFWAKELANNQSESDVEFGENDE
ncbi:MAG: hypothetical protein QN785_10305 [Nitrososphaeraceae archaeon]|nr:hypothetical protein [Nitrososphaeraceae archaeon]